MYAPIFFPVVKRKWRFSFWILLYICRYIYLYYYYWLVKCINKCLRFMNKCFHGAGYPLRANKYMERALNEIKRRVHICVLYIITHSCKFNAIVPPSRINVPATFFFYLCYIMRCIACCPVYKWIRTFERAASNIDRINHIYICSENCPCLCHNYLYCTVYDMFEDIPMKGVALRSSWIRSSQTL